MRCRGLPLANSSLAGPYPDVVIMMPRVAPSCCIVPYRSRTWAGWTVGVELGLDGDFHGCDGIAFVGYVVDAAVATGAVLNPGGAQLSALRLSVALRRHRVVTTLLVGEMPPGLAVRAENRIHGSDQQSCSPGTRLVMITDHVPAVRVPSDHAASRVVCGWPGVRRRRGPPRS